MSAIRIVAIETRARPEWRWRWSWLRMCWQVLTLAEDYVFVSGDPSVCIEGMEEWRPL